MYQNVENQGSHQSMNNKENMLDYEENHDKDGLIDQTNDDIDELPINEQG